MDTLSLLFDQQSLLRFVVPQTHVDASKDIDVHSIDVYLDLLSTRSDDM